jgi:hypothetical protein
MDLPPMGSEHAGALRESLATAMSSLDLADPAVQSVIGQAQHAFTTAMQWTSVAAAVLLGVAAVIAWVAIPSDRTSVSPPRSLTAQTKEKRSS